MANIFETITVALPQVWEMVLMGLQWLFYVLFFIPGLLVWVLTELNLLPLVWPFV